MDALWARTQERQTTERHRCSLSNMNPERAKELLAAERTRIEKALAGLEGDGSLEASDRSDPGDRGSENLYQDEFNEGRTDDLHAHLAAVERAEARLAAGTYGLSVESGEPIPDARLEAVPTAERTIEEQAARR
jgi:DnaK suppressor protein